MRTQEQAGYYGRVSINGKGGVNSTIGAVGIDIGSEALDNFTGDNYSYISLGNRKSNLSSTPH